MVPSVSSAYMDTEIPAAERRRTTRISCGILYSREPIRTQTPTMVLMMVRTVGPGGIPGTFAELAVVAAADDETAVVAVAVVVETLALALDERGGGIMVVGGDGTDGVGGGGDGTDDSNKGEQAVVIKQG